MSILSVGHTSNLEPTSQANFQLEYMTEEIPAVESTTKNEFNFSWQSNLNHISVNKSNFNLGPFATLQSDTKSTNKSTTEPKLHAESKLNKHQITHHNAIKQTEPKSMPGLLAISVPSAEQTSEPQLST